jgi:hypothetical protein
MSFNDSVALNVPQMFRVLEMCYAAIVGLALVSSLLAGRSESKYSNDVFE